MKLTREKKGNTDFYVILIVEGVIERRIDIEKFYNGIYDRVFKTIFCTDKHLMKEFLNRVLDLDIKSIDYLDKELPLNKYNEKSKTIDVGVILNDNKYVHIEVNINGSLNYLNMRNFTFFSGFISTNTRKGSKYNYNQEFIHLDLSKKLSYKELYRTYYVMTNDNKKYIKNVKIIEYNLDRIRDIFYNLSNQEKEKYKVLYMLVSTKEELDKLSIGDELIMGYKEKVNNLNNDEEFISFITREEDQLFILNTEKDISYNDGLKEGKIAGLKEGKTAGLKEGKLAEKKELAKTMKENNYSIEEIKKLTNLNEEEIELL